jgi:hypothetical protein
MEPAKGFEPPTHALRICRQDIGIGLHGVKNAICAPDMQTEPHTLPPTPGPEMGTGRGQTGGLLCGGWHKRAEANLGSIPVQCARSGRLLACLACELGVGTRELVRYVTRAEVAPRGFEQRADGVFDGWRRADRLRRPRCGQVCTGGPARSRLCAHPPACRSATGPSREAPERVRRSAPSFVSEPPNAISTRHLPKRAVSGNSGAMSPDGSSLRANIDT